jgi:hypothetical protein
MNLSAKGKKVVSFRLRPLYPQTEKKEELSMKLVGIQEEARVKEAEYN